MDTIAHRIAASLIVLGLLAGAACAPAAAPSPTAAPTKAAAEPAKPAANTAPTSPPAATPAESKPAASPAAKAETPAAKPAASADWKAEWDKTLAAAKREGKVVVAGGPGDIYRNAAAAFQKAYPDIKLEFTGLAGSNFAPKVLAERAGSQFLWDVHVGGATTMLSALRPNGVLDPLGPALILPEVLDNSKWRGGFEDGWIEQDPKNRNMYMFVGVLEFNALVNRDVVPESQLSSVDQLLDPKWKGKMIMADPRVAGASHQAVAWLLMNKGEDWLRKLLAQDLVISQQTHQVAEALIRGTYPIAVGLATPELVPFKTTGVTANIKPLAPDSPNAAFLVGGFGVVTLVNRAPDPNAAKVYLNWLLSKEGQQAFVQATEADSRRLDVDALGDPEFGPRPNTKYVNSYKEEFDTYRTKASAIAKEVLK